MAGKAGNGVPRLIDWLWTSFTLMLRKRVDEGESMESKAKQSKATAQDKQLACLREKRPKEQNGPMHGRALS